MMVEMLCVYAAGNIISLIYLVGAIKEIRGGDYSAKDCVKCFFSRFLIIVFAVVLKTMLTLTGIMLLIVPALIVNTVFYFTEVIIIFEKSSIPSAYKKSLEITKDKRMKIFLINTYCILTVNIVASIIIMLIADLFSDNNIVLTLYINAFFSAIMQLVDRKRLALLYADLAITDSAGSEELIAQPEGEPQVDADRDQDEASPKDQE
jgi:hypothetical protein